MLILSYSSVLFEISSLIGLSTTLPQTNVRLTGSSPRFLFPVSHTIHNNILQYEYIKLPSTDSRNARPLRSRRVCAEHRLYQNAGACPYSFILSKQVLQVCAFPAFKVYLTRGNSKTKKHMYTPCGKGLFIVHHRLSIKLLSVSLILHCPYFFLFIFICLSGKQNTVSWQVHNR